MVLRRSKQRRSSWTRVSEGVSGGSGGIEGCNLWDEVSELVMSGSVGSNPREEEEISTEVETNKSYGGGISWCVSAICRA